MNGKIKEWHLDEDLLLKLIQEGADISLALTNYLKKTDVIPRNQLDNSIFTEISNRISVFNTQLERYRLINNPIAETDLNENLRTKIQNLKTSVDALMEYVAGQPGDLQALINNAIDARLETSSYLDNIKRDITTELEDGPIANISADNARLREDVEDLTEEFSRHQTKAEEQYRNKNTPIDVSDLTAELQIALSNDNSTVTNLQLQKQDKIEGNPGQIVTISNAKNVVTQDHILYENIAETEAELEVMRNNLASPILFYDKQLVFEIDKDAWNYALEIKKASEQAYTNTALANTNFKTNGTTATINNNLVTITNASLSEYNDVSLGFYGTRCKITFVSSENLKLHFFVDSTIQTISFYANDDNKDLYIENLSEGPHVIRFMIEPNISLVFNKAIGIDNSHAGLLIATDIPDEAMYKNNMYDTGDYFDMSTVSGTYTFTKNNVSKIIPSNAYDTMWLNANDYEGRVIFSKENLKLYYFKNNMLVQLR